MCVCVCEYCLFSGMRPPLPRTHRPTPVLARIPCSVPFSLPFELASSRLSCALSLPRLRAVLMCVLPGLAIAAALRWSQLRFLQEEASALSAQNGALDARLAALQQERAEAVERARREVLELAAAREAK